MLCAISSHAFPQRRSLHRTRARLIPLRRRCRHRRGALHGWNCQHVCRLLHHDRNLRRDSSEKQRSGNPASFAVPVLFAFTRFVQKRMLRAQIDNRAAIARASAIVPETLHCIRTIHALGKESYLQEHYDQAIQESFSAVNRTNFFDAVYSPIIQILQAVLIGLVMLFAASQNPQLLEFFGMSAGTAVAMAAYISQIFGPIENIGMEIQTIQSAAAGVHRMDEFLLQEERWETDSPSASNKYSETFQGPFVIELQDVSFGYEKEPDRSEEAKSFHPAR